MQNGKKITETWSQHSELGSRIKWQTSSKTRKAFSERIPNFAKIIMLMLERRFINNALFIMTWLENNEWESLVWFSRIGSGQFVDINIVLNIDKVVLTVEVRVYGMVLKSPSNCRTSLILFKNKVHNLIEKSHCLSKHVPFTELTIWLSTSCTSNNTRKSHNWRLNVTDLLWSFDKLFNKMDCISLCSWRGM